MPRGAVGAGIRHAGGRRSGDVLRGGRGEGGAGGGGGGGGVGVPDVAGASNGGEFWSEAEFDDMSRRFCSCFGA